MTHLPEVEILRKDLEKELAGKRIKDVDVKVASLISDFHRNRPDFVKALEGRKIESVTRRGATLVMELDEGTSLLIRLGSQGFITKETATEEAGKHTQVTATFTTGGSMHVVDPLKDGHLGVVPNDTLDSIPELNRGGFDPLAEAVPWTDFASRLRNDTRPLKVSLTDENFIIGLGDLYSDEILWTAGLSGARTSKTLSTQEVRRLYRALLEVLFEAVKQGGAVEEEDYQDPDADAEYADHIKVYGKTGEPCARCRRPIQYGVVVSRRKMYYCAQCQT